MHEPVDSRQLARELSELLSSLQRLSQSRSSLYAMESALGEPLAVIRSRRDKRNHGRWLRRKRRAVRHAILVACHSSDVQRTARYLAQKVAIVVQDTGHDGMPSKDGWWKASLHGKEWGVGVVLTEVGDGGLRLSPWIEPMPPLCDTPSVCDPAWQHWQAPR